MSGQRLWLNLQREYWENRTWLFGAPALLMLVLLCLFFLKTQALVNVNFHDDELKLFQDSSSSSKVLDFSQGAQPVTDADSQGRSININNDDGLQMELTMDDRLLTGLEVMSVFLVVAWVTGAFYFFACLYNDREDRSILFWKSLPITEWEVILAKVVFGVVGFTLVAYVFGFVTHWLMFAMESASTNDLRIIAPFSFENLVRMLAYPPVFVLIAFVRGLPWLGLILLASAASKRSPMMTLSVVLFLLMVVEALVFKQRPILEWLTWHLPPAIFSTEEIAVEVIAFQFMQLGQHPLQLFSGVIVGIVALFGAHWFREHRFER